jgi:hypothetical protein
MKTEKDKSILVKHPRGCFLQIWISHEHASVLRQSASKERRSLRGQVAMILNDYLELEKIKRERGSIILKS